MFTTEQINAAQELEMARLFLQIIEEEMNCIDTRILKESIYLYNEHYYASHYQRHPHHFPENRRIVDPRHTSFMDGIDLIDTPDFAGTDLCRFLTARRQLAIEVSFIYGENAKCKASADVIRLERALMESVRPLTKIDIDAITDMEIRRQMIAMTLQLLGPFLTSDPEIIRRFLLERTTTSCTIKLNIKQ